MKSKNYFVNAIGSFLLLTSCITQCVDTSSDEKQVHVAEPDTEQSISVKGDELDIKQDMGSGVSEKWKQTWTSGFPFETAAGGSSHEGVPPEEPPSNGARDGCAPGEMIFRGKCTSKKEVERMLDIADRQAVQKVQKASRPEEQAQATYDLLEQQMHQLEKTEDDLDEIIEQLQDEKREREIEEPPS